MDDVLNDLQYWLNQSLPLYWLVAAVAIALLTLIIVNVRKNRRLSTLDEQRQELEIAKATNEQRIEVIGANNLNLSEKVESNSLLLAQLMSEKAELKSSRDEKVLQLAPTRSRHT